MPGKWVALRATFYRRSNQSHAEGSQPADIRPARFPTLENPEHGHRRPSGGLRARPVGVLATLSPARHRERIPWARCRAGEVCTIPLADESRMNQAIPPALVF